MHPGWSSIPLLTLVHAEYADGNTSAPNNNWLNGGYKGVDFVANIALQHIDFATIHVYPDNWQVRYDAFRLCAQQTFLIIGDAI